MKEEGRGPERTKSAFCLLPSYFSLRSLLRRVLSIGESKALVEPLGSGVAARDHEMQLAIPSAQQLVHAPSNSRTRESGSLARRMRHGEREKGSALPHRD